LPCPGGFGNPPLRKTHRLPRIFSFLCGGATAAWVTPLRNRDLAPVPVGSEFILTATLRIPNHP
jgi:hypothetical protein